MFNYGIGGLAQGVLSNQSDRTSPTTPIISPRRVKDIVLDSTHPEFRNYGEWASIGMVFIEDVTQPLSNTLPQTVAYPLFPNLKFYPLKNEIIFTVLLPSTNLESNRTDTTLYYFPPINIWNSQHHNAIPGFSNLPPSQQKDYQQTQAGSVRKVTDGSTEIELGDVFQEQFNINPLTPFEGDYILEGRFGNSIRMGSSEGKDPITKIRNGQGPEVSEGWVTVEEDINQDKSSIYLTSTQQIPLQPNISNYNSYNTAPETVPEHSKPQIILNSGRIILNSNQDHTLLSSAKSINLNSQGTINVDSKDKMVINSPKIYLGSKDATEPLLLGDQTVNLLRDVLEALQGTLSQLQTLASLPPGSPFVPLNLQASLTSQKLATALAKLETLKSKNNTTT